MDSLALLKPLAGRGWSGSGPMLAGPSLAGARLGAENPFDTSSLQQVLAAGELSTQRLLVSLALMLAGLVRNGANSNAGTGASSAASTPDTNAGSSSGSAGSPSPSTAGNATGTQVERPGGKIDSSIAGNFDAMVAAAKKEGVDLQIESGWRSRQEQEVLYQKYLNGTGNLAAKPGTSNHESGQAIDFKNTPGAFEWLKNNAEKFGFKNLPGEPWHYSVNGK